MAQISVLGAEQRFVALKVLDHDENGAPVATISVSDSGAGIDALSAPRIFEQGFTSKRVGAPDHGFGLSLVHLTVTRRGGTIHYLRSDTSRFEVVLPLSTTRSAPQEVRR